LVHDIGRGLELVDNKESASEAILYADLGNMMIMMGDEGENGTVHMSPWS